MVVSYLITAAALLALLVLDAGAQALRPGVGRMSGTGQPAYAELWPQQWRFFSNYADQGLIAAYEVDGADHALVSQSVRHASAADLWGISVEGDAFTDELAYLAGGIRQSAWTPCGTLTEQACLSRAVSGRAVPLVDGYPVSVMCGTHVLEVLSPVQPAGATGVTDATGSRRSAVEAVRISVTCSEGR